MIGVGFSGMTLMNQDRTNQQASSLIGKILSVKGRNQSNKEIEVRFVSSGQYDLPLQPLLSRGEGTKAASENLSFRAFVATWNVGGKPPDSKLNLDDILQVREESDIYVLGRIIWLGDLNYRIALRYSDTGKLLKEKAWDSLYNNDQLKIEREAGRVFKGWKEGKIYFAPTYKYSLNSDIYAGETVETKSKRKTPAWCDRILWHGSGIYQLSYERKESRFSDHRPVCSTFWVSVEAMEDGLKKR